MEKMELLFVPYNYNSVIDFIHFCGYYLLYVFDGTKS